MHRFLLTPFFCVAFFLSVGFQSRDANARFYEFTFVQKTPDGATKKQKSVVFVRKEGRFLKMFDIASSQQFAGSIDPDKEMSFRLTDAFAHVKGGSGTTLKLHGSFGDKELSGSIVQLSEKYTVEVTALELSSVWACSNHDKPVHTAKSEEEMRDLTAKYQCERWHKLNSSGMPF